MVRSQIAVFVVLVIVAGCQTNDRRSRQRVNFTQRLGTTQLQVEAPVPQELEFRAADGTELPSVQVDDPTAPLEIAVEQAVFTALRNNRSLAVQQLTPVIVGTFVHIERSLYDPRLFADATYSRGRGQQILAILPQPLQLRTERTGVELGVTQPLPTGTAITGSVSHERQTTAQVTGQHTVRAGLTLTQALLQGASLQANLASIRQAEIDRDISEYELRGFAEALVAEVESIYWQFVLAQQRVRIFEESLNLARRQHQETEERVEAGVLARTELPAVRAEVARRQQGLIDARSQRDQLRIELLRLMNPDSVQQWDRPLVTTQTPQPQEIPLDELADLVQLALRWRPELHEARLRHDRGHLEVVRTRNGLLPRLDLFVTLGKSGFAGSFSDAVTDLDGPAYDFAAGLRFDYPIGNRGPRAAHRAAMVSRHQAALSIENLAQLVEADVRRAHLEVLRTWEQIGATAVTRELQEEVLRAESERFQAGVSTALLVAQAQRDLLSAQIEQIEAVVQHQLSLINLYRLSGSLLIRRAIAAPGDHPAWTQHQPPR